MTVIKHRFLNHSINPKTETLIIGTFNPETPDNKADFFYGRGKNYLWQLLPQSFGLNSLKKETVSNKLKFISEYKIDFIDLIEQVEAENLKGYYDGDLDKSSPVWRNIIGEISKLNNINKVCFTRKSFSDIPNMKKQIDLIQEYCDLHGIIFTCLITPARFYSNEKQKEWQEFFKR